VRTARPSDDERSAKRDRALDIHRIEDVSSRPGVPAVIG
jgi:hypothetical protein